MTRADALAACAAGLVWALTLHYLNDASWVAALTSGAIIVFVWWVVRSLKSHG